MLPNSTLDLCSSTSLPGNRGVIRNILKDWACSQLSTQEGGKASWGLLVSAQVGGISGFIFQPGKALCGFQGCRWGVEAPSSGCLCCDSSPTGTSGSRWLTSLVGHCHHPKGHKCFPLFREQFLWSRVWLLSMIYSSRSNSMTSKATR